MKNKLLFVTLLLLLFTFSFAFADDFSYTGENKIIYTNTTNLNPRALSSIAELNGLTYILSSSNDNINSPSLFVYNDTSTNYIDSCASPSTLDAHRIAVSDNSEYLGVTNYIANYLMLYDTNNFCDGGYFGMDYQINIETLCGLRTASHGNDIRYANNYFYIYGDNGFINGKSLCIIEDTPPFDFAQVVNVSTDVRSDVWTIKSDNGLSDDRFVVAVGGIIYEYLIDGAITLDDYIDSHFPTEIKSGRGFLSQEDGEFSVISSKTVFTHGESPLTNETNFPYVEVLGEYYALNPQCVYDDYLEKWFICDDTRFVVSQTSQGIDYLQTVCNDYTSQTPCVTECSTLTDHDDDFDIDYKYGVCDEAPCNMECGSFNQRVCDTSRSYIVCGNYDADACWEWGATVECADGEYCDADANCQTLDFDRSNNELVLPSFQIKPYAISYEETDEQGKTDYVKYTYDLEPNRLNIDTTFQSVIQSYAYFPNAPTIESFYIAKNCDYKENTLYAQGFSSLTLPPEWTVNDGNVKVLLYGDDYELSIIRKTKYAELTHATERANNEIKFSVTMSNNALEENLFVTIKNTLGESLAQVNIKESDALGTKIIFNENNLTASPSANFYNDTGVGSVQEIRVTVQINYETDTYTLKAEVQRTGETQIHYSVPFPFYTSAIADNIYVRFRNNALDDVDTRIDDVSVTSLPLFPSFQSIQPREYNLPCIYDEGCHTSRFYLSSESTPVHTNHVDYTVCVNGDMTSSVSKKGLSKFNIFLDGLNEQEKTLIGFIIFFLIIGIGIYVTVVYKIGAGGIITGITSIAWLFFAEYFGIIPNYIKWVLIVFAGTLSTIHMIKTLGNGGGQ